MSTITIPKKLAQNDDLVVLPRREYEDLLERQIPTITLSAKEKKAIERGRKEIARGEFVTLSELKHELRGLRRKKR